MKKLHILIILLSIFLFRNLPGQDKPTLTFPVTGKISPANISVIYDQMDNPGVNSINSQNFEVTNDVYDCFAADDFAFMDATWSIGSVEVAGSYYSGSGPASSVNVWIYTSDFSGGLPVNIIYSALDIVPSAGLLDGSFTIDLPDTVVLTEGWYWLCIQANMDFTTGGQWGWTGRTVQSFSESAWMNPEGGFLTPCTPSWGYRVTDCGVGTDPDNCFRINGDIIPVELTSFTAVANEKEVLLNWSTATELNNKGFEIQRHTMGNEFSALSFVNGNGTTTEQHNYSFADKNLINGKYFYRLKQLDFDGSYYFSKVLEVEWRASNFNLLEQNYPNPFNPSTTIGFEIQNKSNVKITILNVIGEEVAVILNEEKEAGHHQIEFDATNLPSGVYFYQLKAAPIGSQSGSYVNTKKMILLR